MLVGGPCTTELLQKLTSPHCLLHRAQKAYASESEPAGCKANVDVACRVMLCVIIEHESR